MTNGFINRRRSWSVVLLGVGGLALPLLSDCSSFISVYPNGERSERDVINWPWQQGLWWVREQVLTVLPTVSFTSHLSVHISADCPTLPADRLAFIKCNDAGCLSLRELHNTNYCLKECSPHFYLASPLSCCSAKPGQCRAEMSASFSLLTLLCLAVY